MKRFFIYIILICFSIIIIFLIKTKLDNGLSYNYYYKNLINKTENNLKEADLKNLNIDAPFAVIIDEKTGDILYGKNSKDKCYPASTTKILTAITALENCSIKNRFTCGEELNLVHNDSSKAGLVKGEKLSLETLLKCLLIPSGNDAAYVIAVNTAKVKSGDAYMQTKDAVEYFCDLMNKTAAKIGTGNSHFVNPDGYHDANHYTSAYDMALIARYAMKNKTFRKIVRTSEFKLPELKIKDNSGKIKSKNRVLINTDKLILKGNNYFYKYAVGIKTGHTDEAGYCLVSAASFENREVIAVVMGDGENKVFVDSRLLLKAGLNDKNS